MNKTLAELEAERIETLNQIDEILNTAKDAARSLTDDERTAHDGHVATLDVTDDLIRTAKAEAGDAVRFEQAEARRSSFHVPNINVRGGDSVGAGVTRDLDHLLWTTSDTVRASHGNAQIPVEQVVIRSSVGEAGTVAPRLSAFRRDDHEAIRNFQQTVTRMSLVGMMVDEEAKTSRRGFEVARSLPQFRDEWNHVLRAMDIDTAAEGTEWVPTGIGATLHESVRASGKVAPLFDVIQLPSNPWKMPIEGADLTAYRVAEPTSDTASKVTASTAGTVAATFDAEIFGARTLWSKGLDADSAIAIAPYAQKKIVRAFANAREMAILDGDTDGTHQDTDVQALGATDARSAWDGLRKKALAQTVVTATTSSVANLLAIRKGMLKWGVNPSDLAYIVSVSAVHTLLADTNLLTVDKFGPNATILNGQIGSIAGVPVIVSEFVREDLNASGVDDAITATKTYNLCVNRSEWALGARMALDVKTSDELYLETFQRVAVAFSREDFQHIGSAATNDDTAIAYNVTP
jgi:HK97 family phage major capsid protein